MKRHNVILEGNVEPKDKNVLWLQGNKLKKFGNTGWEDIIEGGVVTTDRIENGAVTTDKIATNAFDSTLSKSEKIAPANIVGNKITMLDEKVDALALGKFYGYFPDSTSFPTDVSIPGYAYVRLDNSYKIWNFSGESWSDSGVSIDENDVIITTDRISDGAVTSEKISTTAFDDTLYVSGKIAPADVVGSKLTDLGKQVIYDITANNNGETFASLSALLSSENLSTLIPYAVRCGGMSIRFIQDSVPNSDNKYVQYRYMGTDVTDTQNLFLDTVNWQGVDNEEIGAVYESVEALKSVINGNDSQPILIEQRDSIVRGDVNADGKMDGYWYVAPSGMSTKIFDVSKCQGKKITITGYSNSSNNIVALSFVTDYHTIPNSDDGGVIWRSVVVDFYQYNSVFTNDCVVPKRSESQDYEHLYLLVTQNTTNQATAVCVTIADGLAQEVDRLDGVVISLDSTVNGSIEKAPKPILVYDLNSPRGEIRYYNADSYLFGYLQRAHNNTCVDIYDVTSIQGRKVTFSSYRSSNNYINYALVTDYKNFPTPSSTNNLNRNLSAFDSQWDNIIVDYQHMGTTVSELTIPTGHAKLYLLICRNKDTQSISDLALANPEITEGLVERVSDLEYASDNAEGNEVYDDTIALRKYINSNFLGRDNAPLYTNDDAAKAISFDDCAYLDRMVRKIKKLNSKSSFGWVTDTHWFDAGHYDETSARKSNELLDYIRKRVGFNKVVFGGDAYNVADTKYKAAAELSAFADDFFSCFGGDGVFCIGNHDCNAARYKQTQDVGDFVPDTEVYARTVAQMNQRKVVYDTGMLSNIESMRNDSTSRIYALTSDEYEYLKAWAKMHYYIDDDKQKIRFIVVESNDEGITTRITFGQNGFSGCIWLQLDFIREALMSLPENYNVVLVSHYMYHSAGGSYGINDGFITACRVLSARKNKTASSWKQNYPDTIMDDIMNYDGTPHNFDFSNCVDCGKIMCLFGHAHINMSFIVQPTNNIDTPTRTYYEWSSYPYSDSLTISNDAILAVCSNSDSYRMDNIEVPTSCPSGTVARTSHDVLNTLEETSFEVISFLEDSINIIKIGAGSDRVFRY